MQTASELVKYRNLSESVAEMVSSGASPDGFFHAKLNSLLSVVSGLDVYDALYVTEPLIVAALKMRDSFIGLSTSIRMMMTESTSGIFSDLMGVPVEDVPQVIEEAFTASSFLSVSVYLFWKDDIL